MELCEVICMGMLETIYGKKDFQRYKNTILESHGIDESMKQILVFAPRRMGKTLTTAVFSVVLALSIPAPEWGEFTILVFSITLVSAQVFVNECKNAIQSIKDTDDFIIEINQQQITFINRKNKSDRRIITLAVSGKVCLNLFHGQKMNQCMCLCVYLCVCKYCYYE